MVRFWYVVGGLVLAVALPVGAENLEIGAGLGAELVVPGRVYVGVVGGGVFVEDLDGRPSGVDASASFEVGWLASVAAGTVVGEWPVRVEIEGGYFSADLDDIDLDGFTVTDVSGDVSGVIVMFNGYYDQRLTDALDWYIGAGAGLVYGDVEAEGDIVGAGTIVAAEEDNASDFAWQLKTGLAVALREDVTLTAGYRLLDVDLAEDTFIHIAEIGLRFGF